MASFSEFGSVPVARHDVGGGGVGGGFNGDNSNGGGSVAASTRTLPPPSPSVRRSNTQETFRRPSGIRKSATLDYQYPDFGGSSTGIGGEWSARRELTPSSRADTRDGMLAGWSRTLNGPRDFMTSVNLSRDIFGWDGQTTGRRTPTYSPPQWSNYGMYGPSYRNGSFAGTGGSGVAAAAVPSSRESSVGRDGTNFSRYSSILDDKHDWGFSTLSRRNSRTYNGFQ